jgi:enterochelin esterase-like enzyme
MKKTPVFLCFLTFSFVLSAQDSKVYDNLTMNSKLLKMDRKYAVYLPPDYETSQRSYPVLYLLHGAGDDQTGWVQMGEVKRIADKAILDGTSTSMIIVMPDANTGRMGYPNEINGKWPYEDFFFQEFIPYIEKVYRIKAVKGYRAISGNSMGGGGTFTYALHHPEIFVAACPLSAGVGPLSLEDSKKILAKENPNIPDSLVIKFYSRQSVLALINNIPQDQKQAVRWYIDCGDDDFLYEGNSLIHIAMRKNEIPHEFRIRNGVHGWTYWQESLPEVLKFITACFDKL